MRYACAVHGKEITDESVFRNGVNLNNSESKVMYMKNIFTQTAEHNIKNSSVSDCLSKLPDAIRKHTDWEYSYLQTENGCFLKPMFENMPYRNSFVPAIDVVMSHQDTQTVLHMRGTPVKSVRIFMAFWFSCLLLLEIFMLTLVITSDLSIYALFTPFLMCALGYSICEIATKITFKAVIKAIRNEFS